MATVSADEHAKVREDLQHRVNLIQSYHDILIAISGEGLLPHHADELNEHFILVKTIEEGLWQAYFVSLSSIYDRDKQSVTLRHYAEILRENGILPEGWDDAYEKAEHLMSKVRLLRNKRFAHVSLEKFSRNFSKEAGLTYNLLSEAAKVTESLLKMLLNADGGRDFVYGFSPKEDLAKLFLHFNPEATWRQGPRNDSETA